MEVCPRCKLPVRNIRVSGQTVAIDIEPVAVVRDIRGTFEALDDRFADGERVLTYALHAMTCATQAKLWEARCRLAENAIPVDFDDGSRLRVASFEGGELPPLTVTLMLTREGRDEFHDYRWVASRRPPN